MNKTVNSRRWWLWIIALFILALLATAGSYIQQEDLSATARQTSPGQQAYNDNCASCHGADLQGTRQGPAFIHPVYEPSHHGDEAFYRAAANGVRAHHWRFGDMPPVPGVTREEVGEIIAYIREQQRANGIQ